MPALATDPRLPSYCRPEVTASAKDVALVHDLLGGTTRMHQRAPDYIAKWDAEEDGVYRIRRTCETVFEGLGRTLSAATGMLFAKPPAIEWNQSEAAISPHWDNLDGAGTKGTVLAKRFSEAAIRDGLGLILVDHPGRPNVPIVTDLTAIEFNLRPTWACYGRSQILNWRTAVIQNQRKLTLVVLHECGEVAVGEYGIASSDRYRVLRLILTPTGYQATWTLYEQQKDDASEPEHFAAIGGGVFKNRSGQIADRLPVAVAYTGRTDAPMQATIPLLGVAWANLSHWQQSTDLRFYRKLCAFPQPTVIGTLAPDATGTPGKLRIGPMVGVQLAAEAGATFTWTELAGTSMDQLEKGILEKVQQMAKMGVAFMQTDTRAAETAEAKRLDATAENSTLATAAQGIEDALNMAFELHAWYLGIEKASAPVISINRDYGDTAMASDMLTAFAGAVQNAGIPVRLLLEQMQVGGLIGPDEDLDALEVEILANQQAKADAEAQAAADRLALGFPDQAQAA